MDKFGIKIKAVVKNNDKYLVVKRWYDDRIASPYQWEFLDGELSFGESPEAAAERIVREQTQLEVSEGSTLYTWSYVMGDTCFVGICIGFNSTHSDIFISEELQDYAWVSKEELNSPEHPMNARVVQDVLKA